MTSMICLYSEISLKDEGFLYFSSVFKYKYKEYNRMQSKHKQIVYIADENPPDYSFLSRYKPDNYTKSKNYLRRRYRNRHSQIPYLLGHPVYMYELARAGLYDLT